ncbi:MAG: TonB-dependent receptor domain-containing protein [Blastocatellia bacterium]
MFKQIVKVISLLIVLGLGASTALAQARSSSADLTGTVSDPSESLIRGATVTAANTATGLVRSATTDSNGAYRIPLLPPGDYELKVEANGFNTQIKKGVTLTVGQTLAFNFKMTVGGASDAVLIETDEPLVEPERTHQSSTITQRPINSLPINGRNFLDFAKLTSGVSEEPPAITSRQVAGITTSGLSFTGQTGRSNSVLIDGVDNNDSSSNTVRPTISQEAVSEFQINRNGYNAEFGRANAGIINLVSKSGANQFHGSVYNYFRNERLDARNTFASAQEQDPPFKRNQPGGAFSGPIKKDKTFFFTAYEGLFRRESAVTTILADRSILQPTASQQDLIDTLVGSGSPSLAAQGQQLRALLTTAPDSPFSANRNTYKLLDSSSGAFPVIETSSTGSFRFDHGLSERDFLFFRYSLTNNSQHNFNIGGLTAPSAGFDVGIRDSTFVVGETHLFSNGLSNEFRFQSFRNVNNIAPVDPFGPRYQIAGIGSIGRGFESPTERTQRRVQFLDNLSLSRGRHNLKFGADFSHYTIDSLVAVFLGGSVDFAQLPIPLGQVLGGGAAGQLATALDGLGRPDLKSVITDEPLTTIQQMNFGFARAINQGFGNPNTTFTGNVLGLYAQDGLKVKPNLHLSFGLRYDYDLYPTSTPRDGNNFAPRFGFAYDPFKNTRTVIRGGGGLYYQALLSGIAVISSVLETGVISNLLVSPDPLLTPISPTSPCGQALATNGAPPSFCFYQQLVARGVITTPSTRAIPESAYLDLLGLTRETSANRLLVRVAKDLVTPHSIHGNLGIDHQFGRDWNVSINYMFNRGINLARLRQVNALPSQTMLDALGRPALTRRADPTRLVEFLFESAGNSIYHGATASINKLYSRRNQVIGSYTFSKTISDTDDLNFDQGPQDPNNARADRGLSAFDLRHRLSVAAIIETPYVYVSPIATARSGFPFDIRTGFDVNLDGVNNDRPFAVGRNTGIGPGFFAVDLRVGRRFRFSDDRPLGLELIFDAFNVLNRTNFKEVNNVTNTLFLEDLGITDVRVKADPKKAASEFSGFTSAYDPRIVQLAVKLNF